jgi:hypothetical protein
MTMTAAAAIQRQGWRRGIATTSSAVERSTSVVMTIPLPGSVMQGQI